MRSILNGSREGQTRQTAVEPQSAVVGSDSKLLPPDGNVSQHETNYASAAINRYRRALEIECGGYTIAFV